MQLGYIIRYIFDIFYISSIYNLYVFLVTPYALERALYSEFMIIIIGLALYCDIELYQLKVLLHKTNDNDILLTGKNKCSSLM